MRIHMMVLAAMLAMSLALGSCTASEPAAPTPAATSTAAPAAATPTTPAAATPAPGATGGLPASAAATDTRPLAERRQEAIARGVAALLKEQDAEGAWGKPQGSVGITALCTDALLQAGETLKNPAVKKAVDYLLKAQKDDGGIYDDAGLKVYATSIALQALVLADKTAYAEPIKKATAFLEKTQWGSDESIEKTDLKYGGFGYGKSNRPDMSNTQFAMEALKAAGVPPDSILWTRAVTFVSRSQDRSESNDKAFAGTDSGGGIYSPVESKADMITLPDGTKVMKTYGSMTYAILKSFLFANLPADDPRVKAAADWVRKHWTFEENPEMGQQGLYYSYLTAAKALDAYSKATKEDKILDAARRPHDWKAELTEALVKRQGADGAWTNSADRWFEGYAPVPTSYALVALATCR
jgi:squalene-hopene/tetraprenyl-beta-curcumene cyclase